VGGGERTEIGRVRKAGWLAASRQNALIRRDVMVPKGSGGRGSGEPDRMRKRQRADAMRQPNTGATRSSVAERKAERAAEVFGRVAKQQAGSVDPGMEPERIRSRCRRAKG